MGFFCLEMCLYLCGWPRAAFGVEGTGLFLPEADIYIEWGGGGGRRRTGSRWPQPLTR